MKIGVIGAGNIGTALIKRFTAVGHEVSVANSRGPASLEELARSTGAHAVKVDEAANEAEVVVVTIPLHRVPELPAGFLQGAAKGAAVIDTSNYYPQRDGRIDEIVNGMPESRWVCEQIGHQVIKVFNTIYAQHLLELGRPKATPGRIALPVAGDDEAAKAVVMQLVDEIGFDPVDAGSLEESWRQQPGSPVYAKDLDAKATRAALAEAVRTQEAP
jgi:predicted dinucleotide-binding enzyme